MFLLDVNVLIALLDPHHLFYKRARNWFLANRRQGWATCPITENGVSRIMSGSTYPHSQSPAVVAALLSVLRAGSDHIFWVDDISLIDSPLIVTSEMRSPKQVTDTYLLALARRNGGTLATFDARLLSDTVVDGEGSIFIIP